MLGALLNPWVLLGALLAGAGIWVHGYTSNDGAERMQAAYERASQVAVEARTKRIAHAREQERLLREANEKERREQDAENKLRDARLADALGELRKRPERPAPAGPADVHQRPAAPATEGGGCSGAGLYRDDAEFLTRRADLAQRIRAQRDACYAQYERAREALRAQGKQRDSP